MPPNKTDVLAYLGGKAPPPPRHAKVTLDKRVTENATYQDILVGPLPISNATTWTPLEYVLTRKTSAQVRNLDADVEALYQTWFSAVGRNISDITSDLWGGVMAGEDTDTLDIWGIDPLIQDEETGRVYRWDGFWGVPGKGFDSDTVLPMGLYFKTDVTGREPANWTVEGWFYDNQFFETTEEFREAYWGGRLKKGGPVKEQRWASTDRRGGRMPMDGARPPEPVAPSGSRYSVDYENNYVEWMGFSFYIGFSRDTGVTLYDIKFQGRGVLYELGMQEALAHYAGKKHLPRLYLNGWFPLP
jgi:primary-amine oxidase